MTTLSNLASVERHGQMKPHNTINVRLAHPFLYSLLVIFAVRFMLQAVNFWTSTPTFDPWPGKDIVAVVWFLIGSWQLVWLWALPRLGMVRWGSLVTVAAISIWGGINMRQSLAGKASFQLPIDLFTLAAIHVRMLMEKPVNPATKKTP